MSMGSPRAPEDAGRDRLSLQPSAALGAAPRSPQASRRLMLAGWQDYLFVLPAILFLVAFMMYPMLFNIQLSLREVKTTTLMDSTGFVGLTNYAHLLADPTTRNTAINTVLFTAGSLVFQLVIGFGLALFYQIKFPGAKVMRSLYLIAWAIPVVVSGVMFKWLFDGDAGLVNYSLLQLGWIRAPIYWLDDPQSALWTIIIANIWLGIPFFLTLLSAALQTVPHSLYEAASIDGANGFGKFCHITLPLLRPALFSCLILGLIYTTRVFDLVWITTQGGPLDASQVVSTLAYKYVFQQFRFGEGAALLNLLFCVLIVFSMAYLRSLRQEDLPT
jgi:multiple sugar transport system permease protein